MRTLIRPTLVTAAAGAVALGVLAVGGPAQAADHGSSPVAKPVPAGAHVVTVRAGDAVGALPAAGKPVTVSGSTSGVKPVGENMEIDPATGCLTREYAARFAAAAKDAQDAAIAVPGAPSGDLVDCWTMAAQATSSGK